LSLSDQEWAPVSIHEVVVVYIRAERDKVASVFHPEWAAMVDNPDTSARSETFAFALRASRDNI